MNKILLIDKSSDWTSFDVVAKIRGALRKKIETRNSSLEIESSKKIKVGHAGTLDPFATGLLIVLIGEATKEQDSFMKLDKEYEATLKLGYNSTTGDPEGEVTNNRFDPKKVPKTEEINNTLHTFKGEISQTPPAYSAIKINGKRAYKLARAGKEFKIEPRNIIIHKIDVLNYTWPELRIKVNCSSGTYIRTLAEDIGEALGCGAYLTALRRTKIGKYDIKDATTVDEYLETLDCG